MAAILNISRHIAQIHQRRHPRIRQGLLHVADLGGHDTLDAG